ncbi:6,7-dimethyl-8-ribityllumazine synthase [Candidatus Arsenophonus lipoptenae]|uniref:6,7-dimethyl-8-ribityllumazine synthase n=1 Tax=Candidatus Arsenophonus lipoptenae TaxID=634113 RepID=A0A0X9W6D7_9GAMM|nr:6,7-dimethyl-8-ribityllumazine synthase [Candidatus Arsenophonus lipoptenae]AMA64822.1 6,7-dimethyl-8-ribityllumazine synthase [Candidatus Arsenophonus lipoptenae]
MKVIKCKLVASKARVAIIVARFNNFINNSLLEGAIDTLERIGQVTSENITVVWIPGAYELPLSTKILVETKKYDAIIALASIIRGATQHFKYIATQCSTSITDISIKHNIPVAFGVLMIDNIEQAIERAGTKLGNKGVDAALAALEMINVIQEIKT